MSDVGTLKYKRVLLKLSGEALAGDREMGLDMPTVENICRSIRKTAEAGAEIGIVVGGGGAEAPTAPTEQEQIISVCLRRR